MHPPRRLGRMANPSPHCSRWPWGTSSTRPSKNCEWLLWRACVSRSRTGHGLICDQAGQVPCPRLRDGGRGHRRRGVVARSRQFGQFLRRGYPRRVRAAEGARGGLPHAVEWHQGIGHDKWLAARPLLLFCSPSPPNPSHSTQIRGCPETRRGAAAGSHPRWTCGTQRSEGTAPFTPSGTDPRYPNLRAQILSDQVKTRSSAESRQG